MDENIRRVFDSLDIEGAGEITVHQLDLAFQQLRLPNSEKLANQFVTGNWLLKQKQRVDKKKKKKSIIC